MIERTNENAAPICSRCGKIGHLVCGSLEPEGDFIDLTPGRCHLCGQIGLHACLPVESIRDRFAMAAPHQEIDWQSDRGDKSDLEKMADARYAWADAMLEASKK